MLENNQEFREISFRVNSISTKWILAAIAGNWNPERNSIEKYTFNDRKGDKSKRENERFKNSW